MLNKDQIIKGCEYAQGFVATEMGSDIIGWVVSIDIENTTSIGMGAILGEGDKNSYDHWCRIYHPLFLNRILEGMNDQLKDFSITQNPHGIGVKNVNGALGIFTKLDNIDDNKELAVKYIFENLDK